MNLEDRILSEISQTEKDEYCVISLTHRLENSPTCSSREWKSGCKRLGQREEQETVGPRVQFQLRQVNGSQGSQQSDVDTTNTAVST